MALTPADSPVTPRPGVAAIVSHDAGGAEVLSSYVRRNSVSGYFVLGGPAEAIFARKLGALQATPLEEAILKADWVLCSTSWQSDLEYRAIQLARALGKHVVVFLDHWMNYAMRLVRAADSRLPDEIWVADRIAAALAARELPGVPVVVVDNPFFADIRQELQQIRSSPRPAGGLHVLYAGEIIDEFSRARGPDAQPYGYTEEQALTYFLKNMDALGTPVDRVTVRPHPAEPPDKYAWALDIDRRVRLGGRAPLLEEIACCDVVAGCESMALVVGLLAGRRVISCVPPGGKACELPQPEIEHLQALVSRRPRQSPDDREQAR
jgi:hypothetical protein